MKCPKCNANFDTVSFENIEVERCSGCRGLWFDILEKEDLKGIEGSQSIDIGDKKIGEE